MSIPRIFKILKNFVAGQGQKKKGKEKGKVLFLVSCKGWLSEEKSLIVNQQKRWFLKYKDDSSALCKHWRRFMTSAFIISSVSVAQNIKEIKLKATLSQTPEVIHSKTGSINGK